MFEWYSLSTFKAQNTEKANIASGILEVIKSYSETWLVY